MIASQALLDLFRKIRFDEKSLLGETLNKLTTEACLQTDATRCAVWLYNKEKSKIICRSLSKCTTDNSGHKEVSSTPEDLSINREDYPDYFKFMDDQRSIQASDALTHPATKCLADSYLKPLGLKSLFDTPIWQMDNVIGVLCLEYDFPKEGWSSDEKIFIYGLADLAAKVYDHYIALDLVEKLASLGKLSAALSHELKNPLHLILNSSNVLLKQLQSDREEFDIGSNTEYLKIINDNCVRATRIIESILAQARGEQDKLAPVNSIVEDSMHLIWSYLRNDDCLNIDYPEYELDPNIHKKVPKIEFQRILINIMENSVKSLREKAEKDGENFIPELKVTTEVVGDNIRLSIYDNGIGIPEENKQKIFNPFFTTDKKDGVGLGLFIVSELVRSLEGEIKLNSQEGEFCKVEILLPIIT